MIIFYNKQRFRISKTIFDRVAFLAISMVGIGHSEILVIAESSGVLFPKIGITIILIYSGLLLALPVTLATMSSLLIVGFTCYTYWLLGIDAKGVLSYLSFYLIFTSCCILINLACIKILKQNLALINDKELKATTDPLTGLHNRRFFEEMSSAVYRQAARDKKGISIILIDLDNFKKVNDLLGHKYGDMVLVEVSRMIKNHLKRPNDIAARIGGDEFVLLVYDFDESYVKQLCQSIIEMTNQLSAELRAKSNEENFGISIGVANNQPGENHPIKMLMELADNSLYSVKQSGKNGFHIGEKSAFLDNLPTKESFKPVT